MTLVKCFVVILITLQIISGYEKEMAPCNTDKQYVQREGNMGETGYFPWLGVLRVKLYSANDIHIALTGVILINERYAISNADDAAKIPKDTLQKDSKVMFIPRESERLFYKVLTVVTHPEYEQTPDTLAFLELDLTGSPQVTIRPVCWPKSNLSNNIVSDFYAVGMTDENQILQKTIRRIQYLDRSTCDEFYNRAGATNEKKISDKYICGFTKNYKRTCIWDSGMALVSNTSGIWRLIGMSVYGPGCSTPARFIDISQYTLWIEAATSTRDIGVLHTSSNKDLT